MDFFHPDVEQPPVHLSCQFYNLQTRVFYGRRQIFSFLSTGFDVFISCFRLVSSKIIVHYPYSFDMPFLDRLFSSLQV